MFHNHTLVPKLSIILASCCLYLFPSTSVGAEAIAARAGDLSLTLNLNPDPPVVGKNHLSFLVMAPPDQAVERAKVTLDSSMYTMSMGGPSAVAAPAGAGQYTALLMFGMGGPWEVIAHVARPGKPAVLASFRFKVEDAPAAGSAPSSPNTTQSLSESAPRGTPPAAASPNTEATTTASSGPYRISIDTTAAPIGLGQIMIHVRDKGTNQPVSDGKLIVKAFMPSMPMGETYHQAASVPGQPGEFAVAWPFQMAGDWEIKAEYRGSKGASDATVGVSPGAFFFPFWAKALLSLTLVGVLIALLNLARTANGRERLRGFAQRKNLAALLILIVAAVGSWLLVQHLKAGQVDWNQMSMQMQDYTAPTPVSVQPAKYGVVQEVTTYTGTIAPYVEDTVSPRVTGRIIDAPYPGTRVSAGQVIVRMEQPDLVAKDLQALYAREGAAHDVMEAQDKQRQARDAARAASSSLVAAGEMVRQTQAKLGSARADASYWQGEIKREKFLLDHGAVSLDEYQSELDKTRAAGEGVNGAEADLRRALADQNVAQANVNSALNGETLGSDQVSHAYAMLNQSHAAEAEAAANADYLTIRAPVSGIVTQRLADPGTVVSPGTPILKLARLDWVRLQANVSAADLEKMHVGAPVTALVAGGSGQITARVSRIFPAANEATRTSVVEAVIPNPGFHLPPGQFVTLQFHSLSQRRVIMAPVIAIVSLAEASGSGAAEGGGGSGVWIAVDGAAHLVPVTVGASNGTDQEILAGLKVGELVITSGLEGLTEGAPISYPGMPQMAPQSEASAKEPGAGFTQKAGDLTVALTFQPTPPKMGEERLQFSLTDASGSPMKGVAIQVKSEMPSMSMGGPSGTAKDNGDGTYSMPMMMGMGGDWRITASITPPGGPAANVVFNFKAE